MSPDELRALFKKLTPAQHRLMAFQGSSETGLISASQKRMCEKLLALGLVERIAHRLGKDRFGTITITVYEVPIPIHMEYCQWCSEQEAAEEAA